jgi:hypothetical protein
MGETNETAPSAPSPDAPAENTAPPPADPNGRVELPHEAPATIPPADVPAAVAEWNAPPESTPATMAVDGGVVINPQTDDEAGRWKKVDVERMTGAVPHLAENAGAGVDNTIVTVNDQIVSMPFFDPADGLWGGVNVGDSVAFYSPDVVAWWPAVVVELYRDGGARLLVFMRDGIMPARAPHQAARAPGGACWAHKNETFTNTGRIAAELKLGVGGAAFEEEKANAAAEEAERTAHEALATARREAAARAASGEE